MKICDTCGGELAPGHPFTLCPKCLFSGALLLRAGGPERRRVAFSNLKVREDFFEKYEILEKVAEGGQGEVWKTWDFDFRRYLAMKRISTGAVATEPAVYRFLAEAQITSQLQHPGILPIFDMGLDPEGRPYYTTQLFSGTTLEPILKQVSRSKAPGEWTFNRVLELLVRICDVMGHAHSRGVIHRDLKPANILVGEFGDVRVIDWGSAHVLEVARQNFEEAIVPLNVQVIETDRTEAIQTNPQSTLSTASSGQPVTLLYTSPEIVAGKVSEPRPSTDIYAMGVILYELLTGHLPYIDGIHDRPTKDELKQRIVHGRLPRTVQSINPKASRDLTAICHKAMARQMEARYQVMEDLADDIRAALEIRPVLARRPTVWLKLQKWSQRNVSHVLFGLAAVVLIAIALLLTRTFKVERDAARRSTLVRNAELAAHSGRWHEALTCWQAAQSAGYNDTVYLGLQEAEAWTVLSEPEKSRAELVKLSRRSDLGAQRGAVLLRLGEHELFDEGAANQGVQHIREALASGLGPADSYFARGLLADSTPEALDFFHQALRYDPYHHGAHRESLSLEFLLGHHLELANHLTVFRILYPDDPSSGYIAAGEAAMAGDSAGAERELALLRNQVTSNNWEEASQVYHAYLAAAKFYDLDALLREGTRRTPLDSLRTNPFSAGVMLIPNDYTTVTNRPSYRIARLPCLEKGFLASGSGLRRLLQPYLANQALAVQEIEFGWQHHPEALIPTLAGMVLENEQPKDGPPLIPILQMQAHLYQMGADSSSMLPQIRRLARYLAARADFELAARRPANSVLVISNCLSDIRQATASPEISALECQAYFQFALKLGDNDLALQLVNLLEQRRPNTPDARRDRIQVELAMGEFGPVLEKVDRLLDENPNDSWALAQRQTALSGLKTLVQSNKISLQSNP